MMFDGIRALSTDDLKEMQSLINAELSQRYAKRKKETWDNLLKVMKEYCKEFGCLEIVCHDCGSSLKVDFDNYKPDDIGELVLINQEEWGW